MKIAIIMGSNSDYETMKEAGNIIKQFNVAYDEKIVSAHRTPEMMVEFAKSAKENGYDVIIAGAGGAAHLPGMVASLTTLPVIGVPVKSKSLEGLDSLLSIVQMPAGIPVATMGINQAANAGLMALRILSISDENLANKLADYKKALETKVKEMELK